MIAPTDSSNDWVCLHCRQRWCDGNCDPYPQLVLTEADRERIRQALLAESRFWAMCRPPQRTPRGFRPNLERPRVFQRSGARG